MDELKQTLDKLEDKQEEEAPVSLNVGPQFNKNTKPFTTQRRQPGQNKPVNSS